MNPLSKLYYSLKPAIPRRFQIFIRRQIVLYQQKKYTHIWPIDPKAGNPPEGWKGWPHGKKFALVLTHDVDTEKGQQKCRKLLNLEKESGFRSSFNFVPERYTVSRDLREFITKSGFEVGVHGLKHDGKLYKSKKIFQSRSVRINHYLRTWESVGFRSPAMHHNLDWIHSLNIEYDASTFDTDPFEPQSDSVGTIYPFLMRTNNNHSRYVELPYTLPQDFTLFILMKEKTIRIWKEKLDWIAENGGMALLNSHPDNLNIDGTKLDLEDYPIQYYEEFLAYVKEKYQGQYWHVLPMEMTRFWMSQN